MLTEVKAIPDDAEAYRAAIVDWVEHGAESPFALSPDEVVARSRPRGADEAEAAACFELGQHLRRTVGDDAAVPWWRRAHELDPGNWTYKRQAWTLVTTPRGRDRERPDPGPERRLRRQLARRRRRRRRRRALRTRPRSDRSSDVRMPSHGRPTRRRLERRTGSLDRRWSTCAGWPSRPCATRRWCTPSPGGTTPATPPRRRVRTLVERWGATAVAEIDPEPFTDFATDPPARPASTTAARTIVWPTVGLWSASVPGGDVAARARARAVAALAAVLRPARRRRRALRRADDDQPRRPARRRAAHPAGADHRHGQRPRPDRPLRPPALALRGPDRHRRRAPRRARPRPGCRAASLWAAVPAYAAQVPSPKAALALRRAGVRDDRHPAADATRWPAPPPSTTPGSPR